MRHWLFVFLFVSSLCLAQSVSRYPSLLWKITGKDLKKPSYLYGTMHVSKRVAWHLSEEFFDALKNVEVVGLETNPGQWLENMQKTGELAEISRPKTAIGYHNDFYANAFRQVFPERKMLQAVLSYDPDIINGLLYRQNRNRENFEENTYIDLFIFQTASKLNKTVISLEDFADAEIQARLAALPDESSVDETLEKTFVNANRIEDAYRDGDLGLLDSLSQLMATKNAQKYLITARNRYFAASIDSVLQHKSIFSGVGAAHLPGPEGVIELLRRKGYTVEPVKGHFNRKSNTERDRFEGIVKAVGFSKQFLPDSNVSADLPGKLYPIFESPSLSYHIQPDMVNGNFYTVVRLRHFGAMFGFSADDMRLRIDSLLFENIAGKIITRSFISSNNGLPGLEVLARTARGDEQRYRIYFNSVEMFLFKLGGRGKYASGKDANRFFNSINFEVKTPVTNFFSPPTAGFKIKPSGSLSYFFSNPGTVGLAEDLLIHGKNQTLLLQHAVYNDFNYLEEDTFELNRIVKNVLANYNYEAVATYTFSKFQNLPGIRFQGVDSKGQKLDGRLVIKGVHYYLLLQFSLSGHRPDYLAFDSFELTDFKLVHPVRLIKDTDFLFSTQDEVTDDASTRFNDRYKKAYQQAFTEKDDRKEKENVFRTATKHYFSPSTNEYLSITFEKYNQYDYRNKKEFKVHLDSVLGNTGGMRRTNLSMKEVAGTLEYNFVLKDTATSRALRTRLIFKNGTMHELTVPFDTLAGLSAWPLQFMNAFTPLDSAAGPDLFTSHFDQLLSDLSGLDSTAKAKAAASLSSLGYAPEYRASFLKFISGPVFAGLDESTRAQFLVSGGTLKSNKIIPLYKTLYKNYTDSFFLQLSVLKGLAYLRTEEGNLAFVQLLNNDPALVGNESIVADVFSVLHDSLPICQKMFPQLLAMRQFEEYRTPVYQLLAELTARKLIPRSVVENSVSLIISDAMLALKRYGQVPQKQMSGTGKDELSTVFQFNGYEVEDEMADGKLLNRPPLQAFATILAPFYTSTAAVKGYYDKLFRIKEESLLMPSLIDLLRYYPKAQDSLVKLYSTALLSRAEFFKQLTAADLQSVFSNSMLSQIELVRSFLLVREGNFSGQKERIKDSLQFFRKIRAANNYQKGDLFIFKTSSIAQPVWKIVFVPESSQRLNSAYQLFDEAFVPDPKKGEEANINTVLDRFSLLFRKRAGSNLFN